MPKRTLRQVVTGQTLVSALPDTTVRAAAVAMASQSVGAIMIVDETGRLIGLFTERDVLNRVVARGLDPDKTLLASVMTDKLQTASPDKPLGHALHLMFEGGFRHVPVVEDGRPVGMVSARNALGLDGCGTGGGRRGQPHSRGSQALPGQSLRGRPAAWHEPVDVLSPAAGTRSGGLSPDSTSGARPAGRPPAAGAAAGRRTGAAYPAGPPSAVPA